MLRMHASLIGLLLVLPTLAASSITASEKKDLYYKAIELNDKGQFKEAAEVFRKVQKLDKTSRYHYNVGQCEYKAKRYGLAIEAFKAFLAGAHKDKSLKKARKHATEALKELTPLVGYLDIQGEPSIEVWVDDTQRGTTPLDAPVMVAEGEHTVVFQKGDKKISKQSVKVTKGKTTVVASLQEGAVEAKNEFERGVALYKAGLYEEASTAFRKANTLNPAWTLLFNIGQSEAAAKRYGLAFEAFEDYLAKGGDDITGERQSLVESELKRLGGLVGSLEIVAPKGAAVYVDGMARGTTPLPDKPKIAVGAIHKVEVVQNGQTLITKKIKISRGETAVIRAQNANAPVTDSKTALSQEASPTPSNSTASTGAQEDKKRLSPIFWVGLAGTVIFGGISGAMWGMAGSKKSEEESISDDISAKVDEWNPSSMDDALEEQSLRNDLDEVRDEMKTYNNVAIAMTAATGAFAIMTVVGAFVKKNRKKGPSAATVSALPGGLKVSF